MAASRRRQWLAYAPGFRLAITGQRGALSRKFASSLGWAALAIAVLVAQEPPARALPSYARQTGQACATCHTAFPELTPYGRQFKLNGYTSGGTRCDDLGLSHYLNGEPDARALEPQIPFAVMVEPYTFTHVKSKLALPDNNNYSTVQQTSLFVGDQLYCNIGAFAQMTFDRPGKTFSWDNTDIRYSSTGVIRGTNIVYGITANNNPTVQDVWNTTPAWSFPYLSSEIAPKPAASTMIQGTWSGRVGGTGAYVWIDNLVYAEITAYGALDPRTLTTLGVSPTSGPRFDGAAPYWRVAVEKTWDKNSLMFGTFGMFANVQAVGGGATPSSLTYPGISDPFTDIGVDAQYQYIGGTHAFTVRASYIWEHQKLSAESNPFLPQNAGGTTNPTNDLTALNVSASYIYDRTISVTGGYFGIWGTKDPVLYASSANASPASTGWIADIAYLPFSHGGPDLWPWLNARLGVTYTHYDKFDGTSNNVDMVPGLKASGNDTVFAYTWIAF